MQTNLLKEFLATSKGQQADSILRSCVHCGFCTATCPTYQLLGDELDSPRGRIYLIKQVLEGNAPTEKTRSHLDRCLTCRSCETTCPSGVQYGQLVDIGREIVEKQVPRNLLERSQRYLLRKTIAFPGRLKLLLNLGHLVKPVMPAVIRNKIPDMGKSAAWPRTSHQRKMLVLAGCAQQVVSAQTNVATANILNTLGIELINESSAGCCGAVSHHLSATEEAHQFIKNNIDAWWPHIEQGIEAIVITASGCGVMVKDYAHILKDDEKYAEKAKRISHLTKDIAEILSAEDLPMTSTANVTVSFHSPCTLQHGQKLSGVVEAILVKAGYKLTHIDDAHLCCGSAGTYSILQPGLSKQLLSNKVLQLEKDQPDVIATANIGCQMHISTQADVPVKHWVELLEQTICPKS